MSKPQWAITAEAIMAEKKIRQSDLVDCFGVTTRSAVGHYFAGRRSIKVHQLKLLASKLEISPDTLNKESSSRVDRDKAEMVLNKWLVRFKQLGWVEYHHSIDSIRDVLVSELCDANEITNVEKSISNK